MAYQNVFVRITDVNGSRQSYSCRKKVNWVDTDMYFSNGARVSAMARYNKENQSCPVIDLDCSGSSEMDPIVINLTNLLASGTTLRMGNIYIDMEDMKKPEDLLKRIVAEQLSA